MLALLVRSIAEIPVQIRSCPLMRQEVPLCPLCGREERGEKCRDHPSPVGKRVFVKLEKKQDDERLQI